MTHDVFLSYSRRDSRFCDELDELLRTRFTVSVYRDRTRVSAGHFPAQLEAALTVEPKPTLLVVASAAAEDSKWVRREIEIYRTHWGARAAEVLVVELHPGAGRRLGLESYQTIDLASTGGELTDGIIGQLWLSLFGKRVVENVERARRHAQWWCRSQLDGHEEDFWRDSWLVYTRHTSRADPESIVLLAQGGSGKSTIAARLVEDLLRRDPGCLPVVLDEPRRPRLPTSDGPSPMRPGPGRSRSCRSTSTGCGPWASRHASWSTGSTGSAARPTCTRRSSRSCGCSPRPAR
ncbi:toll/interleukin-1 receptor domain-containing protein [Pseudonocardia humida]|uniref:Toll/interleukin-1 receptor domain-containing protein n=1 Tax=Pseudonocardia humida TaxID=2800819 RepID=A0ABT1A2B3_9PSEU|nr:toll/interleukin-1 receptor domain-containing protein [Pseudonocardia humida]MCO1657128.1 toll/interleukin-1 receptor domain-containing protein [Pseudonocardia humida]